MIQAGANTGSVLSELGGQKNKGLTKEAGGTK